jgi:hypothetical protein
MRGKAIFLCLGLFIGAFGVFAVLHLRNEPKDGTATKIISPAPTKPAEPPPPIKQIEPPGARQPRRPTATAKEAKLAGREESAKYKWVYEKTEHGWVSRKELVTEETGRGPSAEQREQVTDIRQHALDTIEAFNGILNASSFASRAELYCRFYVDQSPSMVPGVRSEKQAEKRYAELMRSEPPTREGELNRQYQLRAIRDRMEAFAQNVNMCRGVVTAGAQTIPGPDELRKQLAAERLAVSKADELLAHH